MIKYFILGGLISFGVSLFSNLIITNSYRRRNINSILFLFLLFLNYRLLTGKEYESLAMCIGITCLYYYFDLTWSKILESVQMKINQRKEISNLVHEYRITKNSPSSVVKRGENLEKIEAEIIEKALNYF